MVVSGRPGASKHLTFIAPGEGRGPTRAFCPQLPVDKWQSRCVTLPVPVRSKEAIVLRAFKTALGAWAAAALLAMAPSSVLAQRLALTTERAIDAAMQASVDGGWAPGGAVAVMLGGKVVFSRGYGMANLETRTPVSADSVFRVGSLTKQFTAVAVLLLAQDRKLSLDDPANKYLPQVPANDPTTIRQLLNHTAGIADYVTGPDFGQIKWLPLTPEQLVAHIMALKPVHNFAPGTDWAYSSSNYALAGAIVEKVSGEPLRDFLAERLFGPLGMTHTALDDDRAVAPGRASGYDLLAGRAGFVNAATVSMSTAFAAGALRSSVGDLLIWSHALTHGDVLRPEYYRQMVTPAHLNDGTRPMAFTDRQGKTYSNDYALGIVASGDPAHPELTHGGAIDGFTSSLTIFTG